MVCGGLSYSHTAPDPSTKLQYQCEISNRYDALAESTDQWEDFKNTITACATTCLGRKRPRPKKPWITPATLEIIDSRRSARLHTETSQNTAASTQYKMPPLRTNVQLSGRKRQPPWKRLLSVKIKAPSFVNCDRCDPATAISRPLFKLSRINQAGL